VSKKSVVVFLAVVCFQTVAYAQATRTWVSGVGDDVNPCSRTAPCKTYAGAISKTAAGGIINTLDNGAFGALTINKSITIEGDSGLAGTLAVSSNGIVVNAGVNDVVILRNMSIDGGPGTGGINGIQFVAGNTLIVENVTVQRFDNGLNFAPSVFNASGTARLFIKDSIFRNNGGGAPGTVFGGVTIRPGPAGSALGSFDNVRFENNALHGARAEDRTSLTFKNCLASGNTNNGFLAVSLAGGPVDMNIYESAAVHNGTKGVTSNGVNSQVRISNVLVTGNDEGLSRVNNGEIISFRNCQIDGNVVNGVPSTQLTPQ
jgi:hypothetical protein